MNSKSSYIATGFLSRKLTLRKEDGRAYLDQLCDELPRLAPQRYGNFEPIWKPFEGPDAATIGWADPFLWKRQKPSVRGSVWSGRGYTKAHFVERTKLSQFTPTARYFQSAAARWQPEYGYIDIRAEEEMQSKWGMAVAYTYSLGPFIHELRRYLPDLCWANVFGVVYVEMFGKDRLLSAPVSAATELPYGGIYLQLTQSPLDVIQSFSRYKEVRDRVKSHLGPDAFLDPVRGTAGRYRVPSFEPASRPSPRGYIDGMPVTGLIGGRPIVQTEHGPKILKMQWKPPRAS